ncbi:thermonuclease family protein [Pradoshia sp.]
MWKKWLSLVIAFSILAGCGTGDLNNSNDTINSNKDVSEYPTFEATVSKVTDGDTLTISHDGKEEKVRMLLIDTPESVKEGVEPQPWSKEASAFMKEMLPTGSNVMIEPGVSGSEYDRYGRLLAYIYVDGEMLNKTLVEEGYARVAYIYEPNTRHLDELKAAEERAKDEKLRIWSVNGYVTERGFNSEAVKDSSHANDEADGKIKGNKNSKIYHVPGGRNYDAPMKNVIYFDSVKEAEAAGYRAAKE